MPTADQLAALIAQARGTVWETPMILACSTGMRRSEVLAIRWSGVDFGTGRVAVDAGLHRDRNSDGTSELVFHPNKTDRSRRVIVAPAATITRLRRHKTEQGERRLRIGPGWVDFDLVCDNGAGGPLDPDAFSIAFKRFAAAAGLPSSMRLHDARHGVATVLLEQGVHPAIASAVLGHANPAFTMSVYQHVTPNMTDVAAAALDAALGD